MNNPDVEVEPLGDGVCIHLPFRQPGAGKRIGWLPIAFGTFVSLFMIGWIATPVVWGIEILRKGELFGWLFVGFGCTGLIGLYHAIKILAAGVSILRDRTRCTVIVNESQVVNQENFGWFSYKYKFKRSHIEQLLVVPISSVRVSDDREDGAKDPAGFFEFLFGDSHHQQFTITPKKRGGKLIAAAYPQPLLDEVANAIATELNRNQASSAVTIVREPHTDNPQSASSSVTVRHLSDEEDRELEQENVSLPAGSAVEVVEDDGSLVFKVPEKTLARGSSGMFAFSIVWNAFLLFVTFGAIAGKPNGNMWGVFAILGLFWAVGIGMLVGSIYMARQRAMIGIRDGLLFIERKTIFGTKWIEFTAEEIESIEMAHANMEVNGKPVMNLRITPSEGDPVKMFSHLDNGELRWLAQELRNSLGVVSSGKPFAIGNFDPSQPVVPLESSDIETIQDGNRTVIDVPPKPFEGSFVVFLIGMGLVLLPLPLVIAGMFFLGARLEMILVASFLSLIGILMLGIHRFVTTRHGHIVVTDESLEARVRGFMSTRDLALSQPDVLSVDVVDSGLKVNNRIAYCLRIKGKGRRSISMMTGRSERELAYVARLIHQQLKLSPRSSKSQPNGQ